jgi:peroxiredoxin
MGAAHAFGVPFPVPSVFIVDRSGVVRFRHFDPDYTVRLDAAHVLAAAKSAQTNPGGT